MGGEEGWLAVLGPFLGGDSIGGWGGGGIRGEKGRVSAFLLFFAEAGDWE